MTTMSRMRPSQLAVTASATEALQRPISNSRFRLDFFRRFLGARKIEGLCTSLFETQDVIGHIRDLRAVE